MDITTTLTMQFDPLYATMAALAIASPGPGVLMTLTNALQHGPRATLGGILGIVAGTFIIASLCAGGIGALLAASATAFTVLKTAGAAYLIWLGLRLWRAPAASLAYPRSGHGSGTARRFAEAMVLQLSNPKPIFFFLSVFPQFLHAGQSQEGRFASLVLTHCALILAIHGMYALFAQRARAWLSAPRAAHWMNRSGAAAFMVFGVALASAKR